MIPDVQHDWSEFSVNEWMRLDGISRTFDREMKNSFLKIVVQNQRGSEEVRNRITDCVVETGVSTARVYGLDFRPEAFIPLVDELTDGYMKVVENDNAKNKVKEILPKGLSLPDRRNRLDVFGLDAQGAVRLERMRQSGVDNQTLVQARLDIAVRRGNLTALTEVNRTVNATLEQLWLDNMRGPITKARKKRQREWDYEGEWFYDKGEHARKIVSLRGIPQTARKEIVTRRDNRTCNYCRPMEGLTAKMGQNFVTGYGLFMYPPFHPRCRCYMIVSV